MLQYYGGSMKILFNRQFFLHNPDTEFDGAYRIKEFGNVKDTNFEGEEFIKLVHDEDYIKKVKKACMNNQKIAEIQLNEDSWKSACQSVGLTVLASEQMDFAVVRRRAIMREDARRRVFACLIILPLQLRGWLMKVKRSLFLILMLIMVMEPRIYFTIPTRFFIHPYIRYSLIL